MVLLPWGLKVFSSGDPSQRPGLAHLSLGCTANVLRCQHRFQALEHWNTCKNAPPRTEHMLFLGTDEFPDENGFDRFLTAAAGSSNAFTDNALLLHSGQPSS